MENKYKIQLNSTRNINSINIDASLKIKLTNKEKEVGDSERNKYISSSDVFNDERESGTTKYRIYGTIEYMSLLNGVTKSQPLLRNDLFLKPSGDTRSLINSFDFYLLRPRDANSYSGITTNTYERKFDIIANPSDFDIFNAGYSNNLFNEQKYSFIINKYDDNGIKYERNDIPITEYYIYALYKPYVGETVSGESWTIVNGMPESTIQNIISGVTDLATVDMLNYTQTITGRTNTVKILYRDAPIDINKEMLFIYNPFIPIKIGMLGNDIQKVFSGSTSYDQVNSIPEYAFDTKKNGNYVWRNILPQNYIDPDTFATLNYPFVNGYRYCYNRIILDVTTDKSHLNTSNVFQYVKLQDQELMNNMIISYINDIGKPCK